MLLVSSDVKWNASTSRTFAFALLHTLTTQDGVKVGVVYGVAMVLIPLQHSPKSKTGKFGRKATCPTFLIWHVRLTCVTFLTWQVLHVVSNALQAIL